MKIDYLHGQRVDAVKQQGPNWHWEIYLEGGAIIRNKDQRRTAAPSDEIIGTALLSSAVDETAGTVALVFGTVAAGDPPVITNEIEVPMTWTRMGLAVPEYYEELDPSAVETEENTVPPDPSPERAATGPEKKPKTPVRRARKP